MDQTKTGKFIKELRKERKITQKELSESLHVSEKTVSKWETGKGLPDVGMLLPLSKALNISVNELLSGERLDEKQYVECAEKNLAVLLEDKTDPKLKNGVALFSIIITIIAAIGLIVAGAGFADIDVWFRIALIVCAALTVCANTAVILVLGISGEIFECPECGQKFAATPAAYIAGMHTLTKRRLKCPHCGKKSWCRSMWRK